MSTETETCEIAELQELWEARIPCGGVMNKQCQRDCDSEATLIWTNPHHHCHEDLRTAGDFKCASCWMHLYQHLANCLAADRILLCATYNRTFQDVLAFTDFQPF